MSHRPPLDPLLVVLDRPTCDELGLDLVLLCRDLVEAGARFVWYRNRPGPAGQMLADARTVATLLRAVGGELVVGERADVALLASADGVHLSADGLPVGATRELEGLPRVGRSCHTADEVPVVEHQGGSYVTLSPIFPTTSGKTSAREPLGLAELRRAARLTSTPIYALGGITPERVPACLHAGAAGVAVLGGIVAAPDPVTALIRYSQALRGARALEARR